MGDPPRAWLRARSTAQLARTLRRRWRDWTDGRSNARDRPKFCCPVVALYSEDLHPIPRGAATISRRSGASPSNIFTSAAFGTSLLGVNFGWARGRQAASWMPPSARRHGARELHSLSARQNHPGPIPTSYRPSSPACPSPLGSWRPRFRRWARSGCGSRLRCDDPRRGCRGGRGQRAIALLLRRCRAEQRASQSNDLGFQAAELLYGLMNGASREGRQVLVPPLGVVARYSTDVIASTKDEFVAAALRYIPRSRLRRHQRHRRGRLRSALPITFARAFSQDSRSLGPPGDRARAFGTRQRLLADTELSISIIADRGWRSARNADSIPFSRAISESRRRAIELRPKSHS